MACTMSPSDDGRMISALVIPCCSYLKRADQRGTCSTGSRGEWIAGTIARRMDRAFLPGAFPPRALQTPQGRIELDAMSDPPAPLTLSVVVIARGAGTELAECLDSARFAAEMIIVDSGSVDNTVEIARSRGARVIEQAWLGFGPQKNFAVARATHDWI